MRKKRFDKKMIMMMVPALACTLATGVQNAGAISVQDDFVLGPDNYIYFDANAPDGNGAELPYVLDGTDTLTLMAGTDDADAAMIEAVNTYAVIVDNANGASITNHGTIIARNVSASELAAIGVESDVTGAMIVNTGIISAINTSQATVSFDGVLDGSLTNSGTISALLSRTGSDNSFNGTAGIGANELSGEITNEATGLIDVSSSASSGEDGSTGALGFGIFIGDGDTSDGSLILDGGELSGSLTNNGQIAAEAQASADTYAYAGAASISLGALTSAGSLSNDGSLTATATATGNTATASAFGVFIGDAEIDDNGLDATGGDLAGTLTNTGSIAVSAMANATLQAEAGAAGIMLGSLTGSLHNDDGTITAEATANGSSASAYAQGINLASLIGDETLSNSGSITALATAASTIHYATAYATGIYIGDNAGAGGEVSGVLTNSGDITATAIAIGDEGSSFAQAYAYGVYMGDISGTVTNSSTGQIIASATGTGSSATVSAYGISMGNLTVDGSLENNGTISAAAIANASTEEASASANGIYMNGELAGNLTNYGVIRATALADSTSYTASASAYGIDMGNLSGTLTNYGSITATATAEGSSVTAYAYGINMGELSGNLTNIGQISATAIATATDSSAYAYAYGIAISTLSGRLENSGTISATANAYQTGSSDASASAYGVTIGTLSGTLENSGTISATANAYQTGSDDANAYAYGVSMTTLSSADTLDNSEIISAIATATADGTSGANAYAYAYGVHVSGGLTGTLNNSGTITAQATTFTSSWGMANAYGIYAGSIGEAMDPDNASPAIITAFTETAGNLINSGTITATAVSDGNGYGDAYGVFTNALEGSLVNETTGIISATAAAGTEATSSARAYGIYASTLNGTVTNSGIIQGSADFAENGYSLYASSGTGTVTNLTDGLLSGNLHLGGTVSVVNSGTIALPAMGGVYVSGSKIQVQDMGSPAAYIGGDYTQETNGLLSLGATSTSEYARLQVDGTADFVAGAKIAVNLTQGNTIVIGETLASVISADELVVHYTDDTAYFTVTDNSALIDFQAEIDESSEPATIRTAEVSEVNEDVYTDGTVNLVAIQQYSEEMVGAASWGSGTDAGRAMDEMLAVFGTEDEIEPMHETLAILRAMETEQEVAEAVVTTLPSLRLELAHLALGVSQKHADMTRDRNSVARGMNSGGTVFSEGNLWIGTYGAWANQGSNDGAFGYDADTFGVMMGGDIALSPKARIGLGLAFSKSDVDADTLAGQSADVKSYQPFLYGSYALDEFDIDWHLGYGWHSNETTRFVPLAGAVAKGDYDSSSVNAGVAVSKNFKMDEKLTLTPSVRLDYAYIDNDSYDESGADVLNLQVGSSDVDELILGIDGKLDYTMNQDWNVNARLGVGYDMMADKDSVNAAYAGAPGVLYSVYGTESSSWLYRGGVGVTYGQKDSLQVSLQYNLDGREDFTNQAVSLKLGLSF